MDIALCGVVRRRTLVADRLNRCFLITVCLLNHEEPTYFHEPTRSFHTLYLAICSPSLFPNFSLSIEKDLYNSDHFPVILSHDSDTDGKTFPPTYSYRRAD
ncbi:putative RNA-directed DNA polymerase from transposon BS [Trichonephila clavipes]|nr:putative RNA-directed DNA polymerase from transposon BS [Trichonephila clavipes]